MSGAEAKTSPPPPEETSSVQASPEGSSPKPTPAAGASADPRDVPVLPASHWTHAPEDPVDDGDSGIVDVAESTASITSSILKYRTIQGRSYHSEIGNAQYWGSNDDRHSESLDILHHVSTLNQDGKLFLAPIEQPKKVLDVGTGTGIWAIDFADAFPESEVIGTDVSPIQPTWVPPNLQFQIEDCTQEWTFPDNSFDYIHIRLLVGSIADWGALFKEAYRCLAPGGWIESHEGSPNLHSDNEPIPTTTAMGQWGPLFVSGGRVMGRSFTVVEDETQRKAIEEAGFVSIGEKKTTTPTGGWPKDPQLKQVGQLSRFAVLQDAEGFVLFLTGVLGWPRQEVDVYLAHVRKELLAGKYHYYSYQRIVWGQKPKE